MDIFLIMAILTLAAIIAYRGAQSGWSIGPWVVSLFLMVIVFKMHATNHLNLNFSSWPAWTQPSLVLLVK